MAERKEGRRDKRRRGERLRTESGSWLSLKRCRWRRGEQKADSSL